MRAELTTSLSAHFAQISYARFRLAPREAMFAMVVLAVTVPKLLPLLLLICLFLTAGKQHDLVPRPLAGAFAGLSPNTYAVGVFAILGVGLLKAAYPLQAVGLCAAYIAIIITGVFLWRSVRALTAQQSAAIRRGAIAGGLVASAYLTIEFTTNQSIVTWLYSKVPAIAGASKYTFILSDDGHEYVRRHVLNRSTGMLMLLFWPVMLAATVEVARVGRKSISVSVFAIFAASAILLSAHETSKAAFALSVAVFFLVRKSRRWATAIVAAGWIIANIGVVPLVRVAYDNGLQNETLMPGSARARLGIWHFTAQKLGDNWLLGRGIDSVRSDDMRTKPVYVPGEVALQRTGRHSHNIFLQIWYEFGAAGAVLFMVAGLSIIGAIGRLPAHDGPYALAMFTAAAVMMAFSWGLWQHWFGAAIVFSSALYPLSTKRIPAPPGGIVIRFPGRRLRADRVISQKWLAKGA